MQIAWATLVVEASAVVALLSVSTTSGEKSLAHLLNCGENFLLSLPLCLTFLAPRDASAGKVLDHFREVAIVQW